MKIIPSAIPYRWILPIVQIIICTVLLLPIRYGGIQEQITGYQFEFSVTAPQPQFPSGGRTYEVHPPLEYPENPWIEKLGSIRLQTPALLNLPAIVVALPYVILNPAKTDWVPKGMDFRLWRAVSWPIVGLIFWWVAGLGVEALCSARRGETRPTVSWIHTVIGLLAFTCGVLSIIASFFGIEDNDSHIVLFRLAGALWILLGGSTIAAHIIQRRICLRIGASKTREGSPT